MARETSILPMDEINRLVTCNMHMLRNRFNEIVRHDQLMATVQSLARMQRWPEERVYLVMLLMYQNLAQGMMTELSGLQPFKGIVK